MGGGGGGSGFQLERLAFIPQLLLSVVLIPIVLAKRDLASCMLAQTFAFVAFNKVCTSQVCVRTLLGRVWGLEGGVGLDLAGFQADDLE